MINPHCYEGFLCGTEYAWQKCEEMVLVALGQDGHCTIPTRQLSICTTTADQREHALQAPHLTERVGLDHERV